MGHSIGDGIVVLGLAAAFIGYFYFKHRERVRRLEIIHQERLAAMDKGIPLPELPIDPPQTKGPADERVPLILGVVLFAFGLGTMVALRNFHRAEVYEYWAMPLPLAMIGFGLLLYYLLAGKRKR